MSKRKRYDNDATTVFVEEPVITYDISLSVEPDEKKEVSVPLTAFVTSLSAYTIPQINSMEQGVGKCLICGVETNSPDRMICLDCMKKHKQSFMKQTIRVLADEVMDI